MANQTPSPNDDPYAPENFAKLLEATRHWARLMAAHYLSLVKAGVPQEAAERMTRDYWNDARKPHDVSFVPSVFGIDTSRVTQ